MTAHATSLTSWSAAIKTCLDERGLDSQALFDQAGLDMALLADPRARYPLAATTKLWVLAVEATGDDAIGLNVARHVRQTTFHALGYAVMASATLAEAFERMVRYFRVVTDAGELSFEACAEGYRYRISPLKGTQQPADAALDAFMAVIMRSCRALAGREFAPIAVHFRRAAPSNCELYQRVFGVPVKFSQAQTEIIFDRAVVHAALPYGNAELARHNDEILTRLLAQQQRESVPARVQGLIAQRLKDGEPSPEAIAAELHLSLRQLQRKLKDENTSFRDILDATRRELALRYLDDAHYSISEITWLLGFGEASSFSRAFKRWQGVTPAVWRRRDC